MIYGFILIADHPCALKRPQIEYAVFHHMQPRYALQPVFRQECPSVYPCPGDPDVRAAPDVLSLRIPGEDPVNQDFLLLSRIDVQFRGRPVHKPDRFGAIRRIPIAIPDQDIRLFRSGAQGVQGCPDKIRFQPVIRVHKGNPSPPRGSRSPVPGGGNPHIRLMDHADILKPVRIPVADLRAPVRRAVVHQQDFTGRVRPALAEHAVYAFFKPVIPNPADRRHKCDQVPFHAQSLLGPAVPPPGPVFRPSCIPEGRIPDSRVPGGRNLIGRYLWFPEAVFIFCMQEPRFQKGGRLFPPADLFHAYDADFHDFIFFYSSLFQLETQPDVEQDFTDPSVKSFLKRGQFRRARPFFQFKKDIEQPAAVPVQISPLQDHHVEHIAVTALHHSVIAAPIIRVFLPDYGSRSVQLPCIVGMLVMAVQGFDVIVPFLGDKYFYPSKAGPDILVCQHAFPGIRILPQSEVPPVLHQPHIIRVQVFPGPV